jgi:hypothetical protein
MIDVSAATEIHGVFTRLDRSTANDRERVALPAKYTVTS